MMTNTETLFLISLVKNYLQINANYLLTLVREYELSGAEYYDDECLSKSQLRDNLREIAFTDFEQQSYHKDLVLTFKLIMDRQKDWTDILDILNSEYTYKFEDSYVMSRPERHIPLDLEIELWQVLVEHPEIQERKDLTKLINQTITQLEQFKMIRKNTGDIEQ